MSTSNRILAIAFLFIGVTRLDPAFSYEISTQIAYAGHNNVLQGASETWRDAWDYDQYDCYYYNNDISDYGYYCLISYNDPSVYADLYSPLGSLQTWYDLDITHAIASYAFSPANYGIWSQLGRHFVEQFGYVQYCPFYFCYPPVYAAYNLYPLGSTARQRDVHLYQRWPTDICIITTEYSVPDHPGKDFAASAFGVAVKSMDPGVVTATFSGGTHDGNENFVVVRGVDNYYSIYAHVTPSVSPSQSVTVGQTIGVVDNTGTTSGPHSHICRSPDQSCKPNGIDYRPALSCP